MPYLLDANVFMEAKNRYYGFDFCPAFWEWLIVKNSAGIVFSVEKVSDEIVAGHDELSTWAAQRGSEFFLAPDEAVSSAFSDVSIWTTSQGYSQSEVTKFLGGADPFLVSHARAYGHIVVTHERREDLSKKIKIPNVCLGLGAKWMTPFEMLRLEGGRFILDHRP